MTDRNATGGGLYNLYLENEFSVDVIATVSYAPYPGDSGTRTVTVPPYMQVWAASSPGNRFKLKAHTADNVYSWGLQDIVIEEKDRLMTCAKRFNIPKE